MKNMNTEQYNTSENNNETGFHSLDFA